MNEYFGNKSNDLKKSKTRVKFINKNRRPTNFSRRSTIKVSFENSLNKGNCNSNFIQRSDTSKSKNNKKCIKNDINSNHSSDSINTSESDSFSNSSCDYDEDPNVDNYIAFKLFMPKDPTKYLKECQKILSKSRKINYIAKQIKNLTEKIIRNAFINSKFDINLIEDFEPELQQFLFSNKQF